VCLAESKIKDRQDKRFDRLFVKRKEEWTEITDQCIRDCPRQHLRPRHDDVLKMLLPMLEPNETLRKHQEQHHPRYKHFREAFAEYMIDIY
jgi:hypothetical protein